MAKSIKKIMYVQIFLFTLSVFLVLLLGTVLISRNYQRQTLEEEFKYEMELAKNQFFYKVLFARENIAALSSRTIIRTSLYSLNQGEATLEEVREYTQPKYIDGALVYANLLYARRLDSEGRFIAEYTGEDSFSHEFGDEDLVFIRNERGCHIALRNPIFHGGELIGTDEALFFLCKLDTNQSYILTNLQVKGEKSDSRGYPALSLSLPLKDTDYYLYGELNQLYVNDRLKGSLLMSLLQALLLVIIIIVISQFTIMNQIRRLIREQSRAQKTMADQEKQAVMGQMTAGIAHEINNVLTGIFGLAELMGELSDFPDSGRTYLEEIQSSGSRVASFIRKLQDFSHQNMSQKTKIILSSSIRKICGEWKNSREISFSIDIRTDKDEYFVYMDYGQLKTVLINLFDNAREAMNGQGAISLVIDLTHYEKESTCPHCSQPLEGSWVSIKVIDGGVGIDLESKSRIFEPFFTTKAGHKGLGLAQASGILTQCDGHVLCDSTPGQGTEITILLPAPEKPIVS